MVTPFNIGILTKNRLIPDVNPLPDIIQITANEFITTYKHSGLTYEYGSHFRNAMHLPLIVVTQSDWYGYDGLCRHRQRGTGLKVVLDKKYDLFKYSFSRITCGKYK